MSSGEELRTAPKTSPEALNKQFFQEPQIALLHSQEIDNTIIPQQPPLVHIPYLPAKISSPAIDQKH